MLEIQRQQQRIDDLFKVASFYEPETQAHWAKYLCILASGFVENAVELCLSDYCRKRSPETISNYVAARLREFQNPKMDKILELMQSFDPKWRSELEQATIGQLADSVSSIVGNRNSIAHGSSVALSMSRMTTYWEDAKKVVELVEKTCA